MKNILWLILELALAFASGCRSKPAVDDGTLNAAECRCSADCRCIEINGACQCKTLGNPEDRCCEKCTCRVVDPVIRPVPVVPAPVTCHYECLRCGRVVPYTWPDGVPKAIDCKRCSRPGAYQRMRRVSAADGAAVYRPRRAVSC